MEQVIEKNDKNESYKFFLKEVGSHMREYRKMQRLTQAQIARKLRMAFVSYNSIERGVIGTTLKTLFNISQLLEISPARLLSNKDEIFLNCKRVGRLMKSSTLIKQLYDEGYPSKEIAQKLGTTESGLCHFIKKQGWTRNTPKREAQTKNFFKKDLIQKLYTKDYLSISEIAQKVELSRPSVRKVIKMMEAK